MKPDGNRDDIDIALSDAAIEWLVKLRSGRATPADEADFLRWRTQSSAHEAAAREAETIWYGVGIAGEEVRATARKRTRARMTRRTLLGGAVVLGVGAGLRASGIIGPRLFADHVTAVGEQRTVTLPDGSTAALNGNTALSVDFNAMQRGLTLHDGEAMFAVRPDPKRPFMVEANGARTVATGTTFDVDIRATETSVTVVEGRVDVSASSLSVPVAVASNQRIRYLAEGRLTRPEAVDAAMETAWQRGKLIFNGRPLRDVVAEIERHRRGTIVIASSRLRNLAVTGVFETSDPEAILQAIEDTLDVAVTRLPLVTILR
ncbi:MAG: FecR domain-containing protein [Hyphomicrobiaceae bacterium]